MLRRALAVPALIVDALAVALAGVAIAIGCAAGPAAAAEAVAHYDLHVRLTPADRHIAVAGRIVIPAGAAVELRLDERFRIDRFETPGAPAGAVRTPAGGVHRRQLRAPADRSLEVAIDYAGQVGGMDAGLDHREVLGIVQPVVSPAGVYLPAGTAWYPQPDRGRVTYRVRVDLRGASYRAVMPGRLVTEEIRPGGSSALFESGVALPGIDVLAGAYRVEERTLQRAAGREIALRTYFHAELAALAPTYLQAAAQHLARYD